MNFQDAVNEYLLSSQANGVSPATLKWYRSLLNKAAVHFGRQPLTDITPRHLREYIVELRTHEGKYIDAKQKPPQAGRLSSSSVAGHVTALHAFFAWCSAEYAMPNPMANIARPKRREPTPKAIAKNDFMKLFDATGEGAAGARDRAILAFLADSGVRMGGLITLSLDNLNIAQCWAIVNEKGGKARRVNFTRYTAGLIQRWLLFRVSSSESVFVSLTSGQALTESGVNQILKRLKARAGVTGRVNAHSFRHAFAREYVLNGGDVVTLAKLLGHADINTTAAYYAVFTPDELAMLHERYSPMRDFGRGK